MIVSIPGIDLLPWYKGNHSNDMNELIELPLIDLLLLTSYGK